MIERKTEDRKTEQEIIKDALAPLNFTMAESYKKQAKKVWLSEESVKKAIEKAKRTALFACKHGKEHCGFCSINKLERELFGVDDDDEFTGYSP